VRRALLVVALAACGPIDVVVAFVPDGGLRPRRGPPCTSNADCAAFDFCERLDCDDPAGRCARRPALCEAVPRPVCGCNGVTYFNDCYRRAHGATAAEENECAVGASCDAATACPDGASCARLVPACGLDTSRGRCWWGPAACPGVAAFVPCGGGNCTDVCTAIRQGVAFTPSTNCP
jgi:hypothetical protein